MKPRSLLFSFLLFTGMQMLCGEVNAQKDVPFVLGEIKTIESSILSEKRTLNIYLPDGYQLDDTTNYPVIYLLDGSADEDFIHIVGLVQFATFPWVNTLPKSIVVGIANVDRRRDFTYPTTIESDQKEYPTTGKSSNFIAFIEKELQPFINKHYRVSGSKTLIGQSIGGLVATEILLKNPNLFTQYIIVSPSLWWDNVSLLSVPMKQISQPISVYIAVGKEGKVMVKGAKKLVAMLRKKDNISVYFTYFKNRDHANILHEAVYDAFESQKVRR